MTSPSWQRICELSEEPLERDPALVNPDEDPEATCDDGIDNDCNGATDNADTDCAGGACCYWLGFLFRSSPETENYCVNRLSGSLMAYGTDCTGDADSDFITEICDNCPNDPNIDQADADGDLIGDVCDTCDGDDNLIGLSCDSLVDAAGLRRQTYLPGQVTIVTNAKQPDAAARRISEGDVSPFRTSKTTGMAPGIKPGAMPEDRQPYIS